MSEQVTQPLSELAPEDSITNVVIFICDSVRWDFLPDDVSERGVSARTVAPSTFTGSSLPSILGGEYPASHQVWEFNDRLRREPLLLREAPHTGFMTDTIWPHLDIEDKPPLKTTRTSSGDRIETIEEPFVYVEHDKGGHSPYGYSFDECGSTRAFYEEFLADPADIPSLYQRGIERAAERFAGLVDTLEDRGILDETLVVFTSDHGELLGELEHGAVYEHGTPMTPELVYVPLVFMGAGLPANGALDELLSSIDIAPTALGAQGRPVPSTLLGTDVWNESVPRNRLLRSELWDQYSFRGDRTVYAATSIWTDSGGVVSHRGSAMARAAVGLYHHNRLAPHASIRTKSLSAQLNLVRTYGPPTVAYGKPDLDEAAAQERLPGEFVKQETDAEPYYTREQLEKLGYV